MLIGILSDTHNDLIRTQSALRILNSKNVECLVHCGDLSTSKIIKACSILPFRFILGNHDSDSVPELIEAAEEYNVSCLGWANEFTAGDKRIAITHGHLLSDIRELVATEPDYLLCGHSHVAEDYMMDNTRRINPGALFRASKYTVATLNTTSNEVDFIEVP